MPPAYRRELLGVDVSVVERFHPLRAYTSSVLPRRNMTTQRLDGQSIPVSVVLPVLNEALNLPAALASVYWAAEVFVVDSGSMDETASIAEAHGARVTQFAYQPADLKKKAWSLRHLPFSHDWTLYLDADERVPPSLASEIARAVESPEFDGYFIDRQFMFRGKELRSYRPDWNLRLFRHRLARIEDLGLHHLIGTGDNEIHEHFVLSGDKGFLSTALLHHDYRGIGPWIDRHNKYATWEAHLYIKLQREALTWPSLRDPRLRNRALRRIWVRLPTRPVLRFIIWYIGKQGFRDGWRGLQYSLLMAWYEFVITVKIRELEQQQ